MLIQEGDSKRVQLALIRGLLLEGAGTKIGGRKNKNDESLARFDRSQIVSMHLQFYRGHIGGSERRKFRSPFVGFVGIVPLVAPVELGSSS